MVVPLPQYGLNKALSEQTVEPPVPLARVWAASYPSVNSPLLVETKKGQKDAAATATASNGTTPATTRTTLPLLNLAQGVPGHLPHENLRKAMVEEMGKNMMLSHGYGPVFGDSTLRQALAADLNQRYHGSIQESEVAITSGANLAVAVTFHALAGPGDAVILPTPWYFNQEMTLRSLSINVIPFETVSPTFQPDPKALIELLKKHQAPSPSSRSSPSSSSSADHPRIKAMVLVTPNNPTGSTYSKELLREFATICAEWKIALILDETYREFLLDEERGGTAPSEANGTSFSFGKPHDLFDTQAHPSYRWQDSLISIHSFSKSFAIPGHRLGAIIAHSSLFLSDGETNDGVKLSHFGSIAKALDNLQICPPRTDTQRAVAAGIQDPEQVAWRLSTANDLHKRRKDLARNMLRTTPVEVMESQLGIKAGLLSSVYGEGSTTSPSQLGYEILSSGAYYAYVRHPFKDTPSHLVARGLASLVGVVVLPGSFFRPVEDGESDRDLRVSIANVESHLLDTLAARLVLLHALWMSKGVGWGL